MRTYVSFRKTVSLQPGGSENGSSLLDKDGPDVTDGIGVDGFGVTDAKLDWLGVIDLRVVDDKEEDSEGLGRLLA